MSYQLSGNGMRPAYMGGTRTRTSDPFGSGKSLARRQRNQALNKRVRRTALNVINSRAEKKYFDDSNTSTVTDTGFIQDLTSIINIGTGDTARIGDKITYLSSYMRWNMAIASSSGDYTNVVRMIIFQWHQDSNLVPPTSTLLLQSPASGTISPYNHDQGTNFTVLKDIRVQLSVNGNAGANGMIRISSRRIPKRSRRSFRRTICYNTGTTTGMHKLYMFVCSDSTAIPHPNISFWNRVFFTDF